MLHEPSGLNEPPGSHDCASTGVDLNSTLIEIAEILRSVASAAFHFQTQLEPHLGRINAAQRQMNWLFVNLATAAYDALRQGGKLIIATANIELDAATAAGMNLTPGAYVQVELTTTDGDPKPGASALEIIQQVGGRLFERAVCRQGKQLIVLFPRAEAAEYNF